MGEEGGGGEEGLATWQQLNFCSSVDIPSHSLPNTSLPHRYHFQVSGLNDDPTEAPQGRNGACQSSEHGAVFANGLVG